MISQKMDLELQPRRAAHLSPEKHIIIILLVLISTVLLVNDMGQLVFSFLSVCFNKDIWVRILMCRIAVTCRNNMPTPQSSTNFRYCRPLEKTLWLYQRTNFASVQILWQNIHWQCSFRFLLSIFLVISKNLLLNYTMTVNSVFPCWYPCNEFLRVLPRHSIISFPFTYLYYLLFSYCNFIL